MWDTTRNVVVVEYFRKNATVVVCRRRRQSAPEAMKFAGKPAHFSFNRLGSAAQQRQLQNHQCFMPEPPSLSKSH